MLETASPILMAAASPPLLARGCVNVIELENFRTQSGTHWARIKEGVYARIETLLRARLGPSDLFARINDTAYLVVMPTTDPDDVTATCLRVAFDLHMSFLGQCELNKLEVSIAKRGDNDTLMLQRLSIDRVMTIAERAGIHDSQSKGGDGETRQYNSIEQKSAQITVVNQFVPIWAVKSSAITTYACEPRTIVVPPRLEPLTLAQLSIKERVQVELASFCDGADKLSKSCADGNRFLLAVPISFEVLGSVAGRTGLLSACRELSQSLRQYLTFIIYEVPPGVAQSRLANLVGALRFFSRSVSATISPTDRAYGAYQGIGLHAIGFDLREFTPPVVFRQYDAEEIAQFARRTNMSTFLANIKDRAVLKFALDAGIQTLSGPVIAPAMNEPKSMWRLTWAETLAKPDMELWV